MVLRVTCLIFLITVAVVAQERVIQLPPTWPADGRIPERLKSQYVFLSPQQDTIIARIPEDWGNPDGPRRAVRVPLYNQLRPSIRVTMSSPEPGRYRYTYTLSNAPEAKDRIGTWALVVPLEDEAFDMSHPETPEYQGWSGKTRSRMLNAPRVGLPGWPLGCYARWFRNEKSKLVTPGGSVGGFEISSGNRPGLTTAFFGSDIPPPFELLKGSPAAFHKQLSFYNDDPAWRDRPRVTIGPKFPASTPALDILKDYHAGIGRLVTDKRLEADSPFVKELLKALIESIRNDSARFSVSAVKPATGFEMEIKTALEISLPKKL